MIETIDAAVTTVALALTVVLALAIAGAAFRMIVGPGYADRFIALDMLTGIAVAACGLTAVVTGRSVAAPTRATASSARASWRVDRTSS